MATHELESGLVVTDRRHSRAQESPQIDPRQHVPNANGAGVNTPASSVGPTSSEGAGNDLIIGRSSWHAEPWSGWPNGWATPPMGPDHDAWSGEGVGRQATTAKVSTASTCVDLNSRQLGSFPVYGFKGNTPVELPEWRNSPEPELFEGWAQFIQGAVNSLQLRGECITVVTGRYASPDGGLTPGRIARFTTINPDIVDVEFIDGRRVVSMGEVEIPAADVCVVRYQSMPGRMRGIGPLEWCGRSLLTSSALEGYASNLAARGGVPWAVLKGRGNINKQQAETAQRRWVEGAASRSGAPAVLGNDIDLVPVSFSPQDMALLELREFDERRICAAFGVPAYLVNVAMAGSMTYANASQLFDHHWRATLRPLANLLAEAWSRWLLPRGTRLEFNPDRYVQPPLDERATVWQTLHNIVDPATGERAISIAEIRAAERFAPLPEQPGAPNLDAQLLTGGVV